MPKGQLATTRFWAMVEKTDKCWLWNGSLVGGGYAYIELLGKAILAHRFSWMIHNGPIPSGMCVLHRCDIRHCVNPDHLFLGTYLDNARDRDAKKRRTAPRGQANGAARLNDNTIREIRSMRRSGLTSVEIGRLHGIRHSHVLSICAGKLWAHVEDATCV